MIRLGIVDFDTSHVVEFTRRLNHKSPDKNQWVDGAQVVIGCPGSSKIMPERIPEYVKEMQALGVPLVERPDEMIGKVDGMLIESQEGGAHLQAARRFLEAGIPCFVDKPFACSTADAKRIAELATKKGVPVFSSSSLRFAPDVVAFMADPKRGQVIGALTYGPAHLFEKDQTLNPGLYHYCIHAVEILYTLMGPGCRRVTCTHEKGTDMVTGQWKDGRLGSVRGLRAGREDYGALVFTDKAVRPLAIGTAYIYRDLLKAIVKMFETKTAPLDIAVSVEIVAFIEAANKSAANHGAGETVAV
jgi:predicted dehydrogenase